MTAPTIQSLKEIVANSSRYVREQSFVGTLKTVLDSCKTKKAVPTSWGSKHNGLTGLCFYYSGQLQNYLDCQGIKSKTICSTGENPQEGLHELLTVNTSDKGKILIDPTLGQFVFYPEIFVGTFKELQQIFFDTNREFYYGNRVLTTGRAMPTRKDWFDLVYNIGREKK